MKKGSKVAYCLILITFLLLTPLKLFTVKINQPSDPTVAIATTSKIMLSNYFKTMKKIYMIKVKENEIIILFLFLCRNTLYLSYF